MKILLNTFIKIFSIFLGFIIFLTFIWLRFLRERLPKDVPFNLNILGFIILLYICCIYLYILFSLIKKRSANPFITSLINKLYKPLEDFDHFLKDLPFIKPYYKKYIVKLAYKLNNSIVETYNYYYIFIIMPRLVLILTLFVDVFYFHKLSYIYKILWIYIIIFIGKYIIYSLKYAKEHFILNLNPYIYAITTTYVEGVLDDDDDDDDPCPPTMSFNENNLKKFIEFQTESIFSNNHKYLYRAYSNEKYDKEFCIKHQLPFTNRLTSTQYIKISNDIDTKIENIIQISLLLKFYDLNNYYEEGNKIKILIYINYLLCWLYILIISLNSLMINPMLILTILKSFQEHLEPYSSLDI